MLYINIYIYRILVRKVICLFPWKARLSPWSINIICLSLQIFAATIMVLVKIRAVVDEVLVSKMATLLYISLFWRCFHLEIGSNLPCSISFSMSKIPATHVTKKHPPPFPSKIRINLRTSHPLWVRWWKRTSCLTHPAQVSIWRGSFPAC